MKNLNKLARQLQKQARELAKAKQAVIRAEQNLAEANAQVLTIERSHSDTFNEIILEASVVEPEEEEVELGSEGGLSAEGVVVTEKPEMPEEIKAALAKIEETK